MASHFLVADASIPTTSFRSRFSPTHLCLQSKLCGQSSSLYPGNSFSCWSSPPSSLTFHLHDSSYGGNEARSFCVSNATRVQFVGQEIRSIFLGRKDASTESMNIRGCIESREARVSNSKKKRRVCHGFGLHHECAYAGGLYGPDNRNRSGSGQYEGGYQLSSSWKQSCLLHGQSSFELRNHLQRGNANACRCFLINFLKKGFFVTEKDEKQRQRERQRALLSLCVQAMVASQIGQSTLLSFLWTNWPSVVDELCGGKGGGNKNNPSKGQVRDPDNTSTFQSPLWRVLLLGFVCGSVIALAINSFMSAGALIDACLWLCLLYSLLFLAAFVVRILCSTMMFISRGGITVLPNSCTQALQKCMHMSCFQGFFAGISTLLAGMFWLNRGSKPISPTASTSVSSLWSRLSTRIDGKRVGSKKRGRSWQVYSKHVGFLQCMLPKQIKL